MPLSLHAAAIAALPTAPDAAASRTESRGVVGRSLAELNPWQRFTLVFAIGALHLLGLWGLWQSSAVREAVLQAAPMFVSFVALPTPPQPLMRPPAALPKAAPQDAKPLRQPMPLPRPAALIASPPTAAPTAEPLVATLPPPQPMRVAPDVRPASIEAATSVAPAPATVATPAAKMIPDAAVQFLQAPEVVYPRPSQRHAESGLVIVRAQVGTAGGAPLSVLVERSSGHARLDDAALAAVRKALFKPHAENGQPIEGWALVPIRFELEK